MLPESRIMLGG